VKLTKYRLELISRLFTIKATILFLLSFFLMKKKWRSIWNFPGILYNGKLLWLRPQLQSAFCQFHLVKNFFKLSDSRRKEGREGERGEGRKEKKKGRGRTHL